MIFIILLIYFIILLVIEFLFVILSNKNEKPIFTIENENEDNDKENKEYNRYIENDNDNEEVNIKEVLKIVNDNNKLKQIISYDDVDIKNYVGKFRLNNGSGFFINLDKWYLFKNSKTYNFNMPVNILIINVKSDDKIEYLCE